LLEFYSRIFRSKRHTGLAYDSGIMAECYPPISGIHHLKIPTTAIADTLHFYTTLLPFTHKPEYTHRDTSGKIYAEILQLDLPSGPLHLELREFPAAAFPLRASFNFITFKVDEVDALHEWRRRFLNAGRDVSRVLKGLKGEVLVIDDGQHNRIRFYCEGDEIRRPDEVDHDEKWL
jgi:catechol 2,3-dioxygenase-like lactoylglutathione lyase family enzyme